MRAEIISFDIEVFYDGLCPLCMREIRKWRDATRRARKRTMRAIDGEQSFNQRSHSAVRARKAKRLALRT